MRGIQLAGGVVVVTGATSGIGRATALRLVAEGATVVGVARDEAALAELDGVVGLPADVTDADAVERVAAETISRFGRIDGWVNCAGVITFGRFCDVPLAEHRRVLDVDLMGAVHGCRAALPGMLVHGRGVIVNVSSILGVVALPYGAAYSMAKFGLRGLGVSLRQELRTSGVSGVDVATVLPGAVDTPIWRVGGNRSGRAPRVAPPTYDPERVSRIVVGRLRRPRREVVAGGPLTSMLLVVHKVVPGLAERVLAEEVARYALGGDAAPPTSGNLHRVPEGPRRVPDGWNGAGRERTRRLAAVVGTVGAAVGAVAAAAATFGAGRRG
ncbi:SDR family NAD(P)-dependent oxidoreductase [Pseudonocardia oroxyli]|uniref:Short-chain dehydrogenase n=1 Tax=Pseudonocardia oroxyli TaxID=366584 RepID=A0A1G7G9K5_PSEOR|nr:SDR family NAD(P)-dependent oxidoreductase [Pseudonocardia oroxyli]SDE84802.1 Short-chain dehydrogenase [Pseudonocardia oroxyli]